MKNKEEIFFFLEKISIQIIMFNLKHNLDIFIRNKFHFFSDLWRFSII